MLDSAGRIYTPLHAACRTYYKSTADRQRQFGGTKPQQGHVFEVATCESSVVATANVERRLSCWAHSLPSQRGVAPYFSSSILSL
jgi:hypothetical protein